MSEHYDFHYQPTGSGAISGQQVLEQTEDAINELGDYVNDNVGGAMDVAQQALETAQNAEQDAQTALDTANSFSSAIQSAQQDASTALSTAQTAQTTASNANNTALQAQQDASSAVTTANNASGQVSTLSGTVTALGQRVTTAEGNIGQNTSDITALTTRVGTAEGNITTLQNDVSVAMGNASSAMATAGTVKQQAYVFRYSSTALVASSTNSNALLDNTDNLKVGDKVIDSDGVLFSITAIDSVNSTFTIGSALIDLALDGNVVHTSGDETVTGFKTFSSTLRLTAYPNIRMYMSDDEWDVQPAETKQSEIRFTDKNSVIISYFGFQHRSDNSEPFRTCWRQRKMDGTSGYYSIDFNNLGNFYPENDNAITLGRTSNRWKSIYATNYYYGSDNVEFSTKFVTTDTNQTISGTKTFTDNNMIKTSSPKVLLINTSQTGNTAPSSNTASFLRFDGGTVDNFGGVQCEFFTTGENRQTNYVYDITKARVNTIQQRANSTTAMTVFNADLLAPATDGVTALGSSSKRWSDCQTKLINGLTPSSLGMPMTRDNAIDISSYFTGFNNGDTNQYSPTVNGWIYLETTGCNALHCFCTTTGDLVHYGNTVARANDGMAYVTFPVLANSLFKCTWYSNSTITLDKAWFIPCQGNV